MNDKKILLLSIWVFYVWKGEKDNGKIKNQSFNKIAIYLVKFSLEKLDDEDKSFIKK